MAKTEMPIEIQKLMDRFNRQMTMHEHEVSALQARVKLASVTSIGFSDECWEIVRPDYNIYGTEYAEHRMQGAIYLAKKGISGKHILGLLKQGIEWRAITLLWGREYYAPE
jgi:hypothetical protein